MHFLFASTKFLLFERKIYSKYDEKERNEVVPMEGFGLEDGDDDDGKDGQRDGFLYDFQLNKVERSSVDFRTDAVGGNHEAVLNQCDAPRKQDEQNERPVL